MNYYDRMLVSTQELQDRLDDPRLRVFDATTYVDRMANVAAEPR